MTAILREAPPRMRRALLWAGAFLVLHLVALVVAASVDPAGFDPCGPEGQGNLGLQRVVAGAATLASTVHAAWKVRSWYLVPAAGGLLVAAAVWWILLRDPSSFDCGQVATL